MRRFVTCVVLGIICTIAVFVFLPFSGVFTQPRPSLAEFKRKYVFKPVPGKIHHIREWVQVEDFNSDLTVYETVFWEPKDTVSLRELIRESRLVKGKDVLEIGTGSGLLALCCLQAGARSVVATDVNPQALANALFNAKQLQLDENLELRLVPMEKSGAFTVIAPEERFDLIVSNPPWEDRKPSSISEYALYDQEFALLKSLMAGMTRHLRPGGTALVAYGCKEAIYTIQKLARHHHLSVHILDERRLDRLPNVFLPGMLLELRPLQE